MSSSTQRKLRKYVNQIEAEMAAGCRERTAFNILYHDGVTLLDIPDRDVAHEFEVSRPTVRRWFSGENAPHPAMRVHVYEWLRRRAKDEDKKLCLPNCGCRDLEYW